jgi:hypothetical protein
MLLMVVVVLRLPEANEVIEPLDAAAHFNPVVSALSATKNADP